MSPRNWTADETPGREGCITNNATGRTMAYACGGDSPLGNLALARTAAARWNHHDELVEALTHERFCAACVQDGCASCPECTAMAALSKVAERKGGA